MKRFFKAEDIDGENLDERVVASFGVEWSRFDQLNLDPGELHDRFSDYFSLVDLGELPDNCIAADLGCGTGRWAAFVAPEVGMLHLVDASPEAMDVTRKRLEAHSNCRFHVGSLEDCGIDAGTVDFIYSLGVLHHLPDPVVGLRVCRELLRPGGRMLVYLYYRFDNRPTWFRAIWRSTDLIRRLISALPSRLRVRICDAIAALIYWPLARLAARLRSAGLSVRNWPLGQYERASFYTMRTDALDRFGTRVEHRFTRQEILTMLEAEDFGEIRIADSAPWWCVTAIRPMQEAQGSGSRRASNGIE